VQHIHTAFKLNGCSYNKEELKVKAQQFSISTLIFEQYIGLFLLEWLSDKSKIEVQSSGSTGVPKKILLKKQHMVNSAVATGAFFQLMPNSTVLHCLPSNFIAGKMMLVRALHLGFSIDCIEPSSKPLNNILKRYDFSAMVPLQVQNSIEKLSQIKTLIVGGTPMSYQLKKRLVACNTKVYETYGMTETCTHIALKKIENKSIANDQFVTIDNVHVTMDKRDCLVINAPAISDITIVTNDIVALHSSQAFTWLGRYDNVINSGGVKLFPEQIEKIIAKYFTQSFLIAGLPDEQLGQKLAFIVEGDTTILETQKKLQTINELGKFQIPKEIVFLPVFARTANGKVQRAKTLEMVVKDLNLE